MVVLLLMAHDAKPNSLSTCFFFLSVIFGEFLVVRILGCLVFFRQLDHLNGLSILNTSSTFLDNFCTIFYAFKHFYNIALGFSGFYNNTFYLTFVLRVFIGNDINVLFTLGIFRNNAKWN